MPVCVPGWDVTALVGALSRVAWGCWVGSGRESMTDDGWDAGGPSVAPRMKEVSML